MNSPSVTAVIKARNEERQIADCIASARLLAQEIIVMNTSEDRTAEIARNLGAIVLDVPKLEYANSAYGRGAIDRLDTEGWRNAHGDWVIFLDADERISESFAARVREIIEAGRYDAIRYARMNKMFGAIAWHGGWFRANQLKCFRREAWNGEWTGHPHGQPDIGGSICNFPARKECATLHFDYDSVAEMVSRTLLHYAMDEAQSTMKAGRQSSLFRLVWRPPRTFAAHYFMRGGFRDGTRGLILAAMLAMYQFLIEANLWDLKRQATENQPQRPKT